MLDFMQRVVDSNPRPYCCARRHPTSIWGDPNPPIFLCLFLRRSIIYPFSWRPYRANGYRDCGCCRVILTCHAWISFSLRITVCRQHYCPYHCSQQYQAQNLSSHPNKSSTTPPHPATTPPIKTSHHPLQRPPASNLKAEVGKNKP